MRVVTILGPSQAGKSTLTAALAALEGGRPQRLALHADTAVTRFDFMGEPWAILDCPGSADALPLIPTALAASDAAILCVPAEADAAVLAAPYLRMLEAAALPTYLFINKIDAAADRMSDITAALQSYCGHAIVLREIPMTENGAIVGFVDLISERAWEFHEGKRSSLVELPKAMSEAEQQARAELLDHLADFDDALLEELIEDQKPMTEEVYDVATKALQHHDLLPAFIGAAAHNNGLMRLMKSLRHEAPTLDVLTERLGDGEIVALGAFADNVKHLGKTILIRALKDGVGAGQEIGGHAIGSVVGLDAHTPLGTLAAGEIGLTVKSDHLSLDNPVYERGAARRLPDWARMHAPNYRCLIAPTGERDEARLSAALARLLEIDPGITLAQDDRTGKHLLSSQGPLHQRHIVEKLQTVFGIEVEVSDISAALRETLSKRVENHYRHRKQSGGAGQFADVLIEVIPLERGAGFSFSEEVKGGAVPRNYIPSVEAGAQDALSEGPNGHPVVDIAVTLKDGKHHSVDSSDFAFRTAGKMAVKEALTEAGTRVLQPIRRLRIDVPTAFSGALVPLISGLHGQVLGFSNNPDATGWDVFEALLPESAEADLFQAMAGATRGTAWYRSELEHYEEMH
ncbi:MAG: elongation factor G [Hyphomicrobiaceae bacterium]|nr:elongation factor G [Hyphomicrobiaceae bacterium]MCC0023787.1 elongation factor G [Hyphomicrobiaceae bacterium]